MRLVLECLLYGFGRVAYTANNRTQFFFGATEFSAPVSNLEVLAGVDAAAVGLMPMLSAVRHGGAPSIEGKAPCNRRFPDGFIGRRDKRM